MHHRIDRARPRQSDAGFTLLEMLAVVLVMSLMIGLVVSRGPSRSPRLDARAAAGRLVQALQGAQMAAIAGGAPVRCIVDLARQSLGSGTGAVTQMPPAIRMTYLTAAGVPVVAGRTVITFAEDGSSSGGRLAVWSQAARSVITIDPFTGRIEAQDGG